ncbi:unnamed protein product [Chrysodeixis includens]|uniref:Uncharacterized protein n=1 Tax=Chrysodeixis includens TaxID=689277 RepID=A0A9N8KW68_CHRIL|nr:unnamed protein product [Chrysodeixis includens]
MSIFGDKGHALLEPPTPAYTATTVRRAFLVWLHLGQQPDFKHVCNYYHYLENLEDQLSVEQRAASRRLELSLLSDYPPITFYTLQQFPKLYRQNKITKTNVKEIEQATLENCVFNLEGYYDMKIQKGVTTKDIIKTSQLIRKYCKTHAKSLKHFLREFLDFAKKTGSTNSVHNISMYIRKKNVKDEIDTWKNMPIHFSFLDIEADDSVIKDTCGKQADKMKSPLKDNFSVNETKSTNKIKILINESRRKELLNLLPNLPEVTAKKDVN